MSEITEARSARIHFIDGSQRSFAFEPKSIDSSMLASKFQEAMEKGFLTLQMDDRVVVIPMSSVLSLEIVPGPDIDLPYATKVLHEFNN